MADWGVSGHVLIACNCDWGCPCNFNARPSHGHCEGGWIWQIERGRADGVTLDGLALALFAKWPGAIHDGGGQAICYVDERADAAQRTAARRVLRGELGGPWGIFIKTYALGEPAPAAFDIHLSEHGSRARIGQAVEMEFQTLRNPVTQAEIHPQVVLPEGLVMRHGHLATSRVFRVDDTLQFDHSGQYAAFGRFEYA